MSSRIATALGPDVTRRAITVAVVIRLLLALINHTDTLPGAAALTAACMLQIALTFLVLYCVSTFAGGQAIRQTETASAPPWRTGCGHPSELRR